MEILEHGQWGSVCDDTWDLEDAHVVCQQLSCGWAVQALPGLHFPPGQGRIHRDQVNCSGSENYLWDCPGLPGNSYCGHKEDAGVVCSGKWVDAEPWFSNSSCGPAGRLQLGLETWSLTGGRSLSKRGGETQTNVIQEGERQMP